MVLHAGGVPDPIRLGSVVYLQAGRRMGDIVSKF